MKFNKHVEFMYKTAKRSLGVIREVKGIAKIPTKSIIMIYQSLVGSIFTYASCVWQTGNSSELNKLNEVQRKGLALCLDMPTKSSLEVLEVISGVLPLDLRRQEMAVRDLAKIYSYNNLTPIKRKLEAWNEEENPEEHIHH